MRIVRNKKNKKVHEMCTKLIVSYLALVENDSQMEKRLLLMQVIGLF